MLGAGPGLTAQSTEHATSLSPVRVAQTGVSPTQLALVAGQSGLDLPAAWLDPGNYEGPGTLQVTLRVNAAPVPVAHPFEPGDLVSLHVTSDTASQALTVTIADAVAYPAPTLTGALQDPTFVLGGSVTTYDVTPGFSGFDLTYALIAPPVGVTLDPATGTLDISGSGVLVDVPLRILARTPDSQEIEEQIRIHILEAEITATLTPVTAPLYAGQTLQDMADYATMISPANFTSTAGSIQTVSVAVTGAAVTTATPLEVGQSVGFIVTVTDSLNTQRSFVADPITVAFKAILEEQPGNRAALTINPLVPDSETITMTLHSGPYTGSYTLNVGAVRAGLVEVAPPQIEHDGPVADLAPGADVTAYLGVYASPEETLSKAPLLSASGVTLATANLAQDGDTYQLTEAEIGAELVLHVDVDDQAGPILTATSAPLALPAPPGEPPVRVDHQAADGNTVALDLSTAAPGDVYYVLVSAVTRNLEANRITGLDVAGSVQTLLNSTDANSRCQVAAFRYTATGAETAAIPITVATTSTPDAVSAVAWKANGWSHMDLGSAVVNPDTTVFSTVQVYTQGHVLALAADSGRSTEPTLFGITPGSILSPAIDSTIDFVAGQVDITTDDSAYSVLATQALSTQMALVALSLW